MRVHLVNPSDVSFGTAVITPRWLYVLAAATPWSTAHPRSSTKPWSPSTSIGLPAATSSASASTPATRCAATRSGSWRARGARSSSSAAFTPRCIPTRPASTGGAHAVVTRRRRPRLAAGARRLRRGRPEAARTTAAAIEARRSSPARWDLLPADRYMWGSVQTVRGCPKHCSFCSVWRTDGQKPRQRGVDAWSSRDRRAAPQGIPVHALADDNFYPVTLADLAAAERRSDKSHARDAQGIARRSDSS